MKVNVIIVSPGKTKDKCFEKKIEEYKKKIMQPLVLETKFFEKNDLFRDICLKKQNYDYIIKCDEYGQQMNTLEFVEFIKKMINLNKKRLFFFIGDSDGFGKYKLEMVDMNLSLSNLTFTHDMARLILAEQLFRVSTIINNFPYHK